MLARFSANGALDNSFGTGGVVVTDLPDRFDEASAVAIAPDGKVVVAGRSGDDALVARYDVNGRLDTSFGGGLVLLDSGGEEVALAVAVTANGKVVVGGRSYGSAAGVCCTMDALVARYQIDGTLDPSFGGGDGLVTVHLVPGPAEGGSDRFQALQVVPGDGVIAVGTNGGDIATARLRPNGTLDEDFGKGGRVTADLGAAFGERAVGLVRLSDGRLLVAAQTYAQGGLDLALVRFKASGVIDRSFGRSGVVTADVAGATDETGGVVLQPDGRAIVVGVAGLTTTFSFVSARFTA